MANIGAGETRADITITKGSTFRAKMRWLTGPEENRTPVDLTDMIFRMQVRSGFDSNAVMLQLMSHFPPGLENLDEGQEFTDENLLTDISTWNRYTRVNNQASKAAIYIRTDLDPESNDGAGDLTYAQNGKFTLYIPHTITRRLTGSNGIYDVEILDTDEFNNVTVKRLWQGNVTIRNEVTRTPVGDFEV